MKVLLLLKVKELDGDENPRNCGPEKGTATQKNKGAKNKNILRGKVPFLTLARFKPTSISALKDKR